MKKHRDFVPREFHSNKSKLEITTTVYGTYVIYLWENGRRMGKIEEDTSHQKINAVYEFLTRKAHNSWQLLLSR